MSGGRILVVDDDPDVVDYVSTFLRDHGYEVRSAATTTTALDELEEGPVDLVILDVLMPGRSGLDLLVTLRKDPRFAETPIVVLTGHDRVLQEGVDSYLGLQSGIRGADGVLGKPLGRDELLRLLTKLGV